MACISPKAWSHLPCQQNPDATSARSNSQRWLGRCQSPLKFAVTRAETGQLVTQMPRRHSRMPGCQSGAARPMGHPALPEPPWLRTPQPGTPGRCSLPRAFDLLPKPQESPPPVPDPRGSCGGTVPALWSWLRRSKGEGRRLEKHKVDFLSFFLFIFFSLSWSTKITVPLSDCPGLPS